MLIVFGGLPGTGKTTVAKMLARQLGAVYVRIDSIEQALIRSGEYQAELGPCGYFVGYAVAADNLRLGLTVIADSVNPIAITRNDWKNVALDAGVEILEVELVCPNKTEHRRRVESRRADISGHALPNWKDVVEREYESWEREHIVLDSTRHSVDQMVEAILQHLPA